MTVIELIEKLQNIAGIKYLDNKVEIQVGVDGDKGSYWESRDIQNIEKIGKMVYIQLEDR